MKASVKLMGNRFRTNDTFCYSIITWWDSLPVDVVIAINSDGFKRVYLTQGG